MTGPTMSTDNTPYFLSKHAQDLTKFFVDGLKQGTSHLSRRWDAGEAPPLSYNPVTGAAYRGGNQMILFGAELGMEKRGENISGDRRWMTQIQAKSIGAQVREEEQRKALYLVAWKPLLPKRDADKPVDEEREARPRLVGFPFKVYHASQIDGLRPIQVFQERPLDERMAQAQAIVDELGVPITEGAKGAFYMPSKDRIFMPFREAFTDDPAWMATLLHECSHATGHESRLNRKFGTDRQSEDYAREELVAEMSSFDLCRRLGVPFDPSQHVGYFNTWISLLEQDPREILRAASATERVLAFMKVPELVYEKIPQLEKEQKQEQGIDAGKPMEPAKPVHQERAARKTRSRAQGMKKELAL